MNGLSGLFAAWRLFLRKPGAISGLVNKVDTAKFSFRAAFSFRDVDAVWLFGKRTRNCRVFGLYRRLALDWR